MKKLVVLTLAVFLLFGCSQPEVAQPDSTEAAPEPAPTLIGDNLEDYMPSPSNFQDAYAEAGVFPTANESLVENWGGDFQKILDECERIEGIGGLYDLESPDANAPGRIFIVVERFATVEGADAFFTYDFPDGFRQGIYNGDPIDLGTTESAILANSANPYSDDPNDILMTIVFKFSNVNVIVEGQGSADTVTYEYLEPIALSILEKLQN